MAVKEMAKRARIEATRMPTELLRKAVVHGVTLAASEPEGHSRPVRARRGRHCVDAQTANCARFVVPPAREVVDIEAHFVGPRCGTDTARQIHERIGTLYVGPEVAASAGIKDVTARIVNDRIEPTQPAMSQWCLQACRE